MQLSVVHVFFLGMRPICNAGELCAIDPASLFLGHAGSLSNPQLYYTDAVLADSAAGCVSI